MMNYRPDYVRFNVHVVSMAHLVRKQVARYTIRPGWALGRSSSTSPRSQPGSSHKGLHPRQLKRPSGAPVTLSALPRALALPRDPPGRIATGSRSPKAVKHDCPRTACTVPGRHRSFGVRCAALQVKLSSNKRLHTYAFCAVEARRGRRRTPLLFMQ